MSESLTVPFLPPFECPALAWAGEPSGHVVVILPALGVAARHYRPLAGLLQQQGLNVLVAEWPGQHSSQPRPSRRHGYGYRALVERYLPALLRLARGRFPHAGPPVLLGHSLGGQLGTLYLAHQATPQGAGLPPAALFGVACGNTHYRHWRGLQRLKTPVAGLGFILLSSLLGYLPGPWLGFGGIEPPQLIRDWGRVAWRGNFKHLGLPLADAVPGAPACYVNIDGDDFAPFASTRALADQLSPALPVRSLPAIGNPHSGWLKAPDAVATLLMDWLGAPARRQGDAGSQGLPPETTETSATTPA